MYAKIFILVVERGMLTSTVAPHLGEGGLSRVEIELHSRKGAFARIDHRPITPPRGKGACYQPRTKGRGRSLRLTTTPLKGRAIANRNILSNFLTFCLGLSFSPLSLSCCYMRNFHPSSRIFFTSIHNQPTRREMTLFLTYQKGRRLIFQG